MAWVMVTSTKRPMRRASPGKFTQRLHSVLPATSCASRSESCSTSTR